LPVYLKSKADKTDVSVILKKVSEEVEEAINNYDDTDIKTDRSNPE
jgi:hypothetical protein